MHRQFTLHKLSLYLLLLTATQSYAQALCDLDQDVYFSCKTKSQKTVSICDDRKLGLQYRFGTRSHVELIHPKKEREQSDVYLHSSEGHTSAEMNINFKVWKHGYLVYAHGDSIGEKRYKTNVAGVTVFKNDLVIGHIECTVMTELIDIRPWRIGR